MSSRPWFYLAILIIVGGLLTISSLGSGKLRQQVNQAETNRYLIDQANFTAYLTKQTDAHKLLSLAKRLRTADARIVEQIIDRAYQLAPDDRDVVVLASQFHPELKEKVYAVDPLYGSQNGKE